MGRKNMIEEPLTYKEFLKKHQFMKTSDVIAYELYLIIKHLEKITGD